MVSLPKQYAFLAEETSPRILVEAMKLYGTLETPGTADNPVIIGWAKELGGEVSQFYSDDAIPWCGLFMAVCVKRAGLEYPEKPLWALNWRRYGVASDVPMLGDVLTFRRAGGGHVGLYVGEDPQCYHVLGGNQSDSVCITRIEKDRLVEARRTRWKMMQPPSVRKINISGGAYRISRNEA